MKLKKTFSVCVHRARQLAWALVAAATVSHGAAHAADSMPLAAVLEAAMPEAAASAPSSPLAPVRASRRGTLYQVRHHGHTAWLFGTVHVGKSAWYPLESVVTDAFDQAGRLVVELDARNTEPIQAAFVRHGLYPAGDSLEKHLPAGTLTNLRRVAQRYDVPLKNLSAMRPWAVTVLLSSLMLEKAGFQGALGTDQFFLARAGTQTKPVEELESADYQLGLFNALSARQQEKMLAELLEGIEDGSALKDGIEMVEGWSNADAPAVERVLHRELAEKSVTADWMRRIILGKRNVEMAARVARLLGNEQSSERSSFVAVGMLHLLGKDGVPQLLRQRGMEVTKIY